jgi:hypothetical protein
VSILRENPDLFDNRPRARPSISAVKISLLTVAIKIFGAVEPGILHEWKILNIGWNRGHVDSFGMQPTRHLHHGDSNIHKGRVSALYEYFRMAGVPQGNGLIKTMRNTAFSTDSSQVMAFSYLYP